MALNGLATAVLLLLVHIGLLLGSCNADDPFVFYDFKVSYITASPLGVPQQVCAQISCSVFPVSISFVLHLSVLSLAFYLLIDDGFVLSPQKFPF